jgi:hemerythrin-like domain-containing protein
MKARHFIFLGLLLPSLAIAKENDHLTKKAEDKIEEVSPNEDLMREHGVLSRILLIYEEIIQRIDTHQTFPIKSLKRSAEIIRNFIENYHEKLEEDYVFPKFEKAKKMLDLVKTLREQHQQGRILTDYILDHANEDDLKNNSQQLKNVLQQFITMYRPHEAREDTVLFPEFKNLISPKEYESLGELFEEKEHALFGEDGFKNTVEA